LNLKLGLPESFMTKDQGHEQCDYICCFLPHARSSYQLAPLTPPAKGGELGIGSTYQGSAAIFREEEEVSGRGKWSSCP
jgi:hypothetical protein